jgi:hypothetical protein
VNRNAKRNVTVTADGHTTEDKPNLMAKQIIDHYNWVWKAMAPTNGRINVIELDDFIRSLWAPVNCEKN